MKVPVFARYPGSGASSRYRIHGLVRGLAQRGFEWDVRTLGPPRAYGASVRAQAMPVVRRLIAEPAKASNSGVVVVQKEWLPPRIPMEKYLTERALTSMRRLVWDVDDALWRHGEKYRRLSERHVRHADVVVAATHIQAADILAMGARRVEVIPTTMDAVVHAMDPDAVRRIVWIGSPSTTGQLLSVAQVIRDVLRREIDASVHLVGADPSVSHHFAGVASDRVHLHPWSVAVEHQLCGPGTVAIAPSLGTPQEEGRGGFKITKYLAYGMPVIAADTPLHREIAQDGAELVSSDREWSQSLQRALSDSDWRGELSRRGRRRHREALGVDRAVSAWAGILEEMLSRARNSE